MKKPTKQIKLDADALIIAEVEAQRDAAEADRDNLNESLIDDGDLDIVIDQTPGPPAEADLGGQIRLLEEENNRWARRYQNAALRVEAFNKFAKVVESLGYVPPASLRQ